MTKQGKIKQTAKKEQTYLKTRSNTQKTNTRKRILYIDIKMQGQKTHKKFIKQEERNRKGKDRGMY